MDEYRVPKREVRVELVMAGGRVRPGRVFLGDTARSHAGVETLEDLLEGPGDFLAVHGEAPGGGLALLHRRSVVVVRLPEDSGWPEADPLADDPAAHEEGVRLTLDDGALVQGRVRFVLPPGRNRLSDFLNAGAKFLRVEEESPPRVAWVNLGHVVEVVPLP